jgi:hypothetical protein
MQPLVAFYGEHPHDANAVRILFNGLRPDLDHKRTKILKSPPTLVKGLDAAKRRSRAGKVLATLRAVDIKDGLLAVVFHEDTDKVEPSHVQTQQLIRDTYSAAPCEVIAAVPAWELEAWWFLFPDAVVTVSRTWRRPDNYSGRNVGLIRNAKEELARCVRPSPGSRLGREYQEEDSVKIAQSVVNQNSVRTPLGISDSWTSFVNQVDGLAPPGKKAPPPAGSRARTRGRRRRRA